MIVRVYSKYSSVPSQLEIQAGSRQTVADVAENLARSLSDSTTKTLHFDGIYTSLVINADAIDKIEVVER